MHAYAMVSSMFMVPGFKLKTSGTINSNQYHYYAIKFKKKMAGVDKGIKDNRVNMTISTSQVSAVIKTYLKNTKDKLENVTNLSRNPENLRDEVTVSDDAKKILFERIGKRVVEKLKNEMAQNY
jgi:hypothetical protein